MNEQDRISPTESAPDDVAQALEAGYQNFMGMEFVVGRGALVPRAETELLAKVAISTLRTELKEGRLPAQPVLFDLCCGVGNLACAIAAAIPEAKVIASDISATCSELTSANVRRLGLASRVTVLQGDLFRPYETIGILGQVSAIICNPPYISTGKLETTRSAVLLHEPREAFDAGPYGVSIHQQVAQKAPDWLRPAGWLFMEFGAGQSKQLKLILDRVGKYGSVDLYEPAAGKAGSLRASLATQPNES